MYGAMRLPGRAQITSIGSKPPGVYVPWAIDVGVNYPEYLVVPDGCGCSWMAPSIASSHPGLVLTGDPTYQV
jgi:hypothetical protein